VGGFLIIDDDVASCRTLRLHFHSQGYEVRLAHTMEDGLDAARADTPALVILDIRMPGQSGLEGLPALKALAPDTPVIMITAFHDMDTTVHAMKAGAEDYIHKPIDIDELDAAVAGALMRTSAGNGNVAFAPRESARPGANTMVGNSRAMSEVFKIIGMVAPRMATVLITGESGTGKELVARAIHTAGRDADAPFVAVNCAAIVDTLLESDLFGHEKGAFTGAVSRQAGKFALANSGTIFLDEVSELSPVVQAKLLRVLQEKEYVPVGGTRTLTTNARIIAATNVHLGERVTQGAFREDLFYRLQVVTIEMPPLRERRGDLLELVRALLDRVNRDAHRKVTRVAMDVMEAFYAYEWPGNVRELENVLMKAVALCSGELITLDLVPEPIRRLAGASYPMAAQRHAESDSPGSGLASLSEVERDHVARVLAATAWHRGRACEILGVSRPRLRRLIKQHALTPPMKAAKTRSATAADEPTT
jgi:DNA-binding NtrC family response regulator